jgi:hypothetical protein
MNDFDSTKQCYVAWIGLTMVRAYSACGVKRNACKFSVEENETDHFEDLGLDGRIILKLILNK